MAIADEPARLLSANQRQLETLERLSKSFGQSLTGALSASTASGRQLGSVLDSIGAKLAASLGRSAVSTLETTLTSALRGAARALTEAASSFSFGAGGLSPFKAGGVLSAGSVVPFASGGIVAAPAYFPLGRGLGLMGEAGAEAIMPLARTSDGKLGVRGGGGGPTSVTVNIATPDPESFRRSEAQVAAALARAVARGRRAS